MQRAAALARAAPKQILEAKQLEEVICDAQGWNRAAWSAWGGSYGGPERGGMEKEAESWGMDPVPPAGIKDADDGGWTVDLGKLFGIETAIY